MRARRGSRTSSAVVRSGVYFLWWQEKDSSVVNQVVDIEQGRVFTTWVSAEKTLMAFRARYERPRDDAS
jgi:hypothetical protein